MSIYKEALAIFKRKNYEEAYKKIISFARDGHPEAQCIIGNVHHLGLIEEKGDDIRLAVEWYKKSSAQGYGVASNNLATIYQIGEGSIEADVEESKRWLKLAKSQGFLV